jgi:serine protease Do
MNLRLCRLAVSTGFWWLAVLASLAVAQKPPRYAALLANGERIEGNTLQNWYNNNVEPHIDGKNLMEQQKPLRWLRDRALLPGGLPKAFVEMQTGDRLPGVVVDFAGPESGLYDPQLAHFLVRPEIDLKPPQKVADPIVRVIGNFVRRIVWQKRDKNDFEPNTIFYRDGRALPFRAARFGPGYVNVLLAEGNRRVLFNEMAEIHLAKVDPWQAYFDELAVLDLDDPKARLYQIDTTEGLIVTSSYFRRLIYGNNQVVDQWVHGLQPAWSLDVLYIPNDDIWCRRMWAPHEVPLSRIAPSAVKTQSPLMASGRTPKVNANVEGGPLRSATHDFGWGFGVHANAELTFDLTPGVKALHSQVALDRLAGKGGCVKARIFANATSSGPLWESSFLVGSENVADIGTIGLKGPAEGQKSIILQIDAAHAGRPEGADPLDVRDSADWLDPWIELDPAVMKSEVSKRGPKQFAAWQDWNVSLTADATWRWHSYINELNGQQPANYRSAVAVRKQPLVLSRDIKLGPEDNWLVLFANRGAAGGQAVKLEVRIGGEPVAEYEVPQRQRGNEDQAPLTVRLSNYQAAQKPIHVEIRQMPTADPGNVDWRSIEVVPQLPHLYQAFEDQGVFTAIDADQKGGAKLFADDRHYGTQSVQITPDGQFRLKFPKPIAIREQPKWGEYRHIRFAFRKVGDGQFAIEVNRTVEGERPARYDAGAGPPVGKSATRLWNANLPNQWIVMTRDLYADFGAFDATGITVQTLGGEYALVDHVYIARRTEDFNLIPNAPPPELVNQKARRDLAKPILDHAFPRIVMLEMKDGRIAGGSLISRDGEVLTAGHVVAKANEECKVHLPTGKTVKAKTRGIWRDFDIGLIKISEQGDYPYFERANATEIPENQLYVGFAHAKKYEKDAKPAANILAIRRVFRGMVWTDFESDDWSSGTPLVNREGKVLGVLSKRSEFGGFLFGRLDNFDAHLGRMRNGEVYGAWYPGTGPMFGLDVQSTREGAKVLAVHPNSPAAAANLKKDDIVTKIDGRSVVSLEDIYAILAEKNPGQECTLDYFSGGQMLQAKIVLVPRVP